MVGNCNTTTLYIYVNLAQSSHFQTGPYSDNHHFFLPSFTTLILIFAFLFLLTFQFKYAPIMKWQRQLMSIGNLQTIQQHLYQASEWVKGVNVVFMCVYVCVCVCCNEMDVCIKGVNVLRLIIYASECQSVGVECIERNLLDGFNGHLHCCFIAGMNNRILGCMA